MTPCEQTTEWIDAWLDNELSAEDDARLTDHCAACDACRRAWDAARALQRDFGQLAAAAERIVSDQPASRVTQKFKRRNHPTSRTWAWRIAAAVALATTIALATREFSGRSSHAPMESRTHTPVHADSDSKEAYVVADAEGIVLRHPSHGLAVQYATNRPSVQVIWLYEPTPQNKSPAATTAPGA